MVKRKGDKDVVRKLIDLQPQVVEDLTIQAVKKKSNFKNYAEHILIEQSKKK